MSDRKVRVYNTLSIICGTWFLLTGSMWVYWANLFFAYPVAVAGIYFWNKARSIDPENKWSKYALGMHIAGVAVSLTVLVILLFYN